MKDVMWGRGQGKNQDGALELRQSGRTNYVPLFDAHGDSKEKILAALKEAPRRVSHFYEEWPSRPGDFLCEAAYRQMLLELEADGQIQVMGKDGATVCGVDLRRKRLGKPTLGKNYFVRLTEP